MKNKVDSFFAKSGINLEKITPKQDVQNLINSLHPKKTQFDLIRVGPNGDGGYLVPDDLKNIEACYSPGVDLISEFELWCLKNGMDIYLADKSVEEVNLSIPKNQYSFLKKFIGCTNNEDFITLDQWVNTTSPSKSSDLLLQMDIEGGEYDTLINVSDELLSRFRVIVIEFHDLHKFWNPAFYKFANIAINKLLQTHTCVHIHPNNCCGSVTKNGIEIPRVAEFTFIRTNREEIKGYQDNFPHQLDYDNTNLEHMKLSKDWYQSAK